MRLLENYAIIVPQSTIDRDLSKLKFQFHQFPYQPVIAVLVTLDGEPLVASSYVWPYDPRCFVLATAQHMAQSKVVPVAFEAINDRCLSKAYMELNQFEGTDQEFMERYRDLYAFTPLHDKADYTAPNVVRPVFGKPLK